MPYDPKKTYFCWRCGLPLAYVKYEFAGYYIGQCYYFTCANGHNERVWEGDDETFTRLLNPNVA